MKRSRVASEALKWVVWMQTSQSIDKRLPDFEKWLTADRENRLAYMQARQEWFRWDGLAEILSKDRQSLARRLAAIERRRNSARRHREFLWIVLGISVLALLMA